MKSERKKSTFENFNKRSIKNTKLSTFIATSLIIILGFIVYSNSLNGEFIWDDNFLIKNNVYIRDWSNISKIFAEDWGAGAGIEYTFYRPLCNFTYLVNYSIGKLDVKGYHLVNIILHILVSLTLYWFITILYDNRFLSGLASIFFLIHPIHTEAVAYISGRPDSLAALFMLLCFVFYIKYLRVGNLAFYVLTLLSYILALLSKENSLIFPALILLYHYTFKKKIRTTAFMSLLSITFIYIVLRLTVLESAQPYIPSFNIVFQRIPGFFVAIINYIRLLVLPFNLHMEYGSKLFSFSDIRVILGCIISFSILIYAFKRREKDSLTFFSIFWFFIAYLPVSNIYPVAFYMAEHYLYLPSIGFFLILANGINSLYKAKNFRIFTLGSIILSLLAFYSYLTIKQNNYWKESIDFHERTLKYAPHTPSLLNSLGNAYAAGDKYKKAILAYQEAIEVDPNYPDTYNNLGCVYVKLGKIEKARELFEKAIHLNPDYADAYNNLGSTYGSMGRNGRAIELYKKAIEINPNYVLAHSGLAAAYYFEEQYNLAIKHCDRALELGHEVHPEILEFLKPYRK